jgi:ubiquinone/menaquinone biosynthesis C-methylase UbiE
MERVLEPEVMDTAAEAEAYDLMDHTEVNRAFVSRFLDLGGGGRVIDLGCGPAHIAIELCRRDPFARVCALDASDHMLERGRARALEAGLGSRIELVRGDAMRTPYPDRAFDSLMSNSIVHHLPDPRPFLWEVARLVREGGAILLRDLFRPESDDELWHLVDIHAGDATSEQQKLFADSLHAAFTPAEVAAMLAECGLGDLRVYASSDRHWTAEREGVILRIDGHVERALALTFTALAALRRGRVERAAPQSGAEGLPLEALLSEARPLRGASHVRLHAADLTASLALGAPASRAEVLFCEGSRPLAREHGGPVRLAPGIDRCAGVKHLRRIEIACGPPADARVHAS